VFCFGAILLLRSTAGERNLNLTRGEAWAFMRKETQFLDIKAGGRVRYRIWKYVIDLGQIAHDLAFTPKGAFAVKKFVSNERSSTLEIETFQPKGYCKSLIEILKKYVQLLGAYQPAVRRLVGKPSLLR